MIRQIISAVAMTAAGLVIAGCQASATTAGPGGGQDVYGAKTVENQETGTSNYNSQTAGYQSGNVDLQAQGNYSNMNMPIRAQVNSSTGDLRVINNTDRDITDIRLTANGNYTAHIDRLPAHGSMVLTRNDFQGGTGGLTNSQDFVRNLQIQANGQNWTFNNTQSFNR